MKKKQFFEHFFIILFVVIVLLTLGITTYQSIVTSDWYVENERKKEFQEDISKLNDEGIKYIEYYDAVTNTEKYFYDIGISLFSEMACDDYLQTLNQLESHKVYSSDRVSVFFEDDSLIDFYITDEMKVYWDNLEINAPNLVDWYSNIKD